ncbi:MAG: hypothetical protein AAGD35_11310 [Actinomycetota bacterium]
MTTPTLTAPEPVAGASDDAPLSPSQIERWRTAGYALVDGLLPDDLVEAVAAFGHERFPAPETREAAEFRNFGSAVVFPTQNEAFDHLTLHPRLLAAIGQLLGRRPADLRLTQSDLWPKYGRPLDQPPENRYDNNDQRIHVDYPNHTLVHPSPWSRPDAVEAIVYYGHHAECAGGTAVVPRIGVDDPLYPYPITASPGIGTLPYINDRPSAEDYLGEHRPDVVEFRGALYDREVHTDYRPGTVLLYRHDTWHRGTPLRPGVMRLAQNLTFRTAEAEWIQTLHKGWSWAMYRPDQYMERFVAAATPDQRAVLGFPPPGSPYWCPETVAAAEARYGPFGFDPTPYRAGLDA